MRKIPQIVRAESTSFIVPVYSSVSSQPPYEIHLPVNTVLVLFFLVFYSGDPLVYYKNTQPIVEDQAMENIKRKVLRLPEFWVVDPVSWFAHVEAHFELEKLESQQHRYFNVIKAHSLDSLRLIKDIIANPHPMTPCEVLKDRLLNNHSLIDFQKIERQL
jgi:hypothetical protein